MVESARLVELVEGLIATGGPISFYDAMTVVHRARAAGDLRDAALEALVRLHDSTIVTDGAREILAEFLRVYVARLSEARARAQRPITLADHNKTARAKVGEVLELELEERAGFGFRWDVDRCSADIHVERLEARRLNKLGATVACFRVRLFHAGHVVLTLEERPPPTLGPPSNKAPKARSFVLRVVVDQ